MNLDKFWNGTLGAFWRAFSQKESAPKVDMLAACLTTEKSPTISFICSEDLSYSDEYDEFRKQYGRLEDFVSSVFVDGGNPDHVFDSEVAFLSVKGMGNMVAVWRDDGGIYAFACNINDRARLALLLGNVLSGKLEKGDSKCQ